MKNSKNLMVKDINGKAFKISKNDPRYISGELIPIMKNVVTVKDFTGNTFSVAKTDPRYLSGELIYISSTKEIYVKFNKRIFLCKKNDPNLLNNTYVILKKQNKQKYRHVETGDVQYFFAEDESVDFNKYQLSFKLEITVKDKEGKSFNIFRKDERYISGELIPVTTKYVYFCKKHGIQRNISEFKRLKEKNLPEEYKIYCPECKKFYLSENYIPSEDEIEKCKFFLNTFKFNSSLQLTEKYFNKLMPHFLSIILSNTSFLPKNILFSRRIYMFKKDLKSIPKCILIGCDNDCYFLQGAHGISQYCNKHHYSYSISKGEQEIKDWLTTIYYKNITQTYRRDGKELDIFIPDLNLGIEFNGIYWHGDNVISSKTYHYDKWKYFDEKNIKVITVWEDDWNLKKELVKSMLINQLQLNQNKIYARHTKIRIVNNTNTNDFLTINHIQGKCQSSISLGLYCDDKLVSLMTFGKKRMILGNINLHDQKNTKEFELLRFCNMQNTTIIGGASKLFKHFIKQYDPDTIISYANLDISKGNLYEILGFKNIGHTGINYWWAKDKRYHRSNFMKHILVKEGADPLKTENIIMRERGYWKIYGIGNYKYIWNKKRKDI